MLVDSLDGTGGAERFAVGLALALPREEFDVGVCVTHTAEGSLPAELEAAGVSCLQLGRRGRWDLLPLRRLGAILRAHRIDVLHCHKFGSNVWGSLIGRLAGVPVIVAHEHTWSYHGQPLRKFLDGQVIGRLAHAFVAVSDADRRRMIAIEGVAPRKAITIPTGFVPRPRAAEGNLRAELGISADSPVVGTVTALRPQKALEVLLDAFALLRVTMPNAELVVVGDGPSRKTLEAHARGLGLTGVHFTGVRNDLAVLLDGIDVAAMSSDYEGLPLFAFECLHHRTPLVATAVGGLPDLIQDNRTGLLVAPRDPDALAEALEGLLRDPERRARMAGAALETLADYSMEQIAARFGRLYGQLLTGAARGSRPPISRELTGSVPGA